MLTLEESSQIISHLEARSLLPEFSLTKTRFRHPQRLSRLVTINRTKENKVYLSFSHPLPDFAERWDLSLSGELPAECDIETIKLSLDDFFENDVPEAPPGSPPFETTLKAVQEIINRYSNDAKRANNYELTFEDLVSIGTAKAYEVWLRFGDKPTKEFECLVATSIKHRFDSLLSKHYEARCRAGAEIVSLSDEMSDILPALMSSIDPTAKKEFFDKLDPNERALVETLLEPPEALRRDSYLERLRYEHVKNQLPKSRLPFPKYSLKKISIVTDRPLSELTDAYKRLNTQIPSNAWEELVEAELENETK
jgi:hypothetical protein